LQSSVNRAKAFSLGFLANAPPPDREIFLIRFSVFSDKMYRPEGRFLAPVCTLGFHGSFRAATLSSTRRFCCPGSLCGRFSKCVFVFPVEFAESYCPSLFFSPRNFPETVLSPPKQAPPLGRFYMILVPRGSSSPRQSAWNLLTLSVHCEC